MSEYLIASNKVFIGLQDFIDYFSLEAEVINKAKCELLNYGKLEDFSLSRGMAYVKEDGGNYEVYYNDVCIYLEVEDNMIVNYVLE